MVYLIIELTIILTLPSGMGTNSPLIGETQA